MEKIKLENKENNLSEPLFKKNNNIDCYPVCEKEIESYEGIEVIDKTKKAKKHFFEYFIGLW